MSMAPTLVIALVLLGAASAAPLRSLGAPQPATMAQLECAVNTFAASFASARAPPALHAAINDALNLEVLCNASVTATPFSPSVVAGLARDAARVHAARDAAIAAAHPRAPSSSFFVSAAGSDAAAGTQASPFATLPRAAAAARGVTPRGAGDVIVFVRAGTYYIGDAPLVLTAADSNVSWVGGWPGDAPNAPSVLSGGRLLTGLSWRPAPAPLPVGVQVAPVIITDARADAWAAAHGGVGKGRAGPPPLVQSLFLNGQRQVRARYPNANADGGSGPCFSATQRDGEGCAGWSSCAMGSMGVQPAPSGVELSGFSPDRGDSPVWGCPQCHENGKFRYTIYPYPPDHPVYTAPLPGIGWKNLSLFSFWASPFSRPSGVKVDPSCGDRHWASVNYSNRGEGAVVQMFHSGLWGGWSFAVDNITRSTAPPPTPSRAARTTAASLPPGVTLWLRADDLPASLDGSAVMTWPDASGSHADAVAGSASTAPIFNRTGWGGTLPAVHFADRHSLANTMLKTPAEKTIFAVMRDTGSTTTYGSGIFCAGVSDNGLGSKVTDAVASNDDDPPPVGTAIPVLMLDWSGSPADPGHRVLSRPSLISATFSSLATSGFVNGCSELFDGAQGKEGVGYTIGVRRDAADRFLVGDIAELIVFSRAINDTERESVDAYLWSKWDLPPPPKHCAAAPSADTVNIAFGYGGFQEARGSGINAGQHFYIENVLEELDQAGEWFFDAHAQLLYVWPNNTDLDSASVAVPISDAIVSITGDADTREYATGISFSGFTFTQSRITSLEMYEVPSGGDWSVHRGGAVFVQDAEAVSIVDCVFTHTGGNGVFFSNHVTGSAVTDCEFTHTGDSGIVFAGSTVGVDGSAPTYPNHNLVARNVIHEWGIYGKQTSCFAQQLSANSTIVDNACFNGPRAGINYNDGFGGNNLFRGNVVFNAVRETGDHGPLNSWDRQPYWTRSGVVDGFNDAAGRSFIRAVDTNENNLMLNGYNGVWTFDHDDSSQFVVDINNFMVFGGCKNYVGDRKNCTANVILYPGITGRSGGGRLCQTDDNGVFAEQFFEGNTCATADGEFYSFSGCTPSTLATTVYVTKNNTLFADAGATFAAPCHVGNFSSWQGAGQDEGSTTATTPDVAALIALGAAKVLGD